VLKISESPLNPLDVIEAVSHPSAGAIDVFIGVVRDHNEGKPVALLEYEAYPSMAEREFLKISDEIQQVIPGIRLAAIHRVGALRVGEVAVVCAASASHRAEAFTACRKFIDEVKARLPVWKREHGPNGPYWVGWMDARCHPEHEHQHHNHNKTL